MRLENVATFAKYLGGSPANTAVGASRLGLRAAMISRVGNEPNGGFVRETLVHEGVDVSQVSTDPERLTALVFLAMRDRTTSRTSSIATVARTWRSTQSHIDPAFIASCGALLISGTHLSQDGPRAASLKADRRGARGGHARDPRHRLPPGALGAREARRGRRTLRRLRPRDRAPAGAASRLRAHRRHGRRDSRGRRLGRHAHRARPHPQRDARASSS